ncbi:MAG: hypothetical protein BWK78_04300, partial [Thiotrichaceae bacterium IS1]
DALTQFRQRSDKKYCLDQYYFEQFAFFTQWQELKEYAKENGVYLFGDMPFFVARDSVEMWAHRECFLLDEQGVPRFFSGVPPTNDYFHPDKGQCWGHPLYDWNRLEEDNFQWWLKRFNVANRLFDLVRLTYFRGFHCCWAIRNRSTVHPKPNDGEWHLVPEESSLFAHFQEMQLHLQIVAEDIGVSEEVIELRNEFKFPGIKLLQIAFDLKGETVSLKNYHLPHCHMPRDVVYTGTHDSDTTISWFERVKNTVAKKKFVCEYLNAKLEEMPKPLIQSAFQSVAKLAIIPMQDILSLGGECRMNTPGTSKHGNWRWQFAWSQVTLDIEQKLKELVERYERK